MFNAPSLFLDQELSFSSHRLGHSERQFRTPHPWDAGGEWKCCWRRRGRRGKHYQWELDYKSELDWRGKGNKGKGKKEKEQKSSRTGERTKRKKIVGRWTKGARAGCKRHGEWQVEKTKKPYLRTVRLFSVFLLCLYQPRDSICCAKPCVD